ncbi:MAG: trypsin-like peptidase domain-containing protein, partial [Deltaproteobacteria bacterium]|nr:trypsin-like peptidase domain-containing protein [Deltaproteobacteria bacterium]
MRFCKNSLLLITIITISIIICSEASGGKLYKWIDEKGSIHFSDRLPEGADILNQTVKEEELKEVRPDVQTEEVKVKFLVKDPIEFAINCTFTIKGSKTLGTGFFISSNGYAVTCKHVIEDNGNHTAVLNNQDEFPIGVISTSDRHDLALVLVITSQKTPCLKLEDAEKMTAGERIFAIGSSIGLQST